MDVPDGISDGSLQFKENVRVVFVNCTFHCSLQIITVGVRSGDRGGQISSEIILSRNTSRTRVMET
jgi:hypothetical protein